MPSLRGITGYAALDAKANLVEKAEAAAEETYHELVTRAELALKTAPRTRPDNVKEAVVRERGFTNRRQQGEDVTEFSYRPGNCKKDYRVVVLRKDISVAKGENVLFSEHRYFFYITNEREMTADEVIAEARSRCNQENLIAQLKGQVRALHAPVNTLVANWAYTVMAALAWSIKAWCALLLPVSPRWADKHSEEKRRLLTMEFRTFLQVFIEIPAQVVKGARGVRWRILAWGPWLGPFFRLLDVV